MRPRGALLVALLFILGQAMGQLQGASLRIVTVPQAPFVYYNPALPGNEAWSGYLIDFWDLVVQDINENNNQFFNFTFYNSPDGRFGGRDSSGVWNGMIKEILDGNADLAVADFTITAVRSEVTAWTVSFENIGLALMVPAKAAHTSVWKFLSPFTSSLWLSLLAISIAVSVLLWVSDRLSPYGWSKQARRKDRMNLSYPNSLLASLLLFLGNGNMVLGRSWGTRILQWTYIAFSVIVLANYTANLAAAYTVRRVEYSINSFNDLARATQRFAVMNGTSAQSYIQRLYPAQAANMVTYNNQTLLLEDLRRQKISAYVNDKGLLEYLANQPPCNLFVVGNVFNPATYGIAMPQTGFEPIRQMLSTSILHIVESGAMQTLRDRWFSAGACGSAATTSSTQLTASDLAGAFALVAIGLAICLGIVLIEWIFVKSYKRCHTSQAAKEMSDFFGGEAEDPIARWRATSIRGIFRPPPPELAHRRQFKKHALHPHDANDPEALLHPPENPLVDLHLATTLHRLSTNAASGGASAPVAPGPPAAAPAPAVAALDASAAAAPPVSASPVAASVDAAAPPVAAANSSGSVANPISGSNTASSLSAPDAPLIVPINPSTGSSLASSPAPAHTTSQSVSSAASSSPSLSSSPPGSLTKPVVLGGTTSPRPMSPPERRPRLMTAGPADLPQLVTSPPPPRRQRITSAHKPDSPPAGAP